MGQSALGPETWRWMGQHPKGLGYGQHIVVFMQRLQQDAGVMLQNQLLRRHVMAETSYATAPLLWHIVNCVVNDVNVPRLKAFKKQRNQTEYVNSLRSLIHRFWMVLAELYGII